MGIMTIIKIISNNDGGHSNQSIDASIQIPEGWAVIPEDIGTITTLKNFPFGNISVEDVNGVPTVTSWTPLPIPEPSPEPEEPDIPSGDTEARLSALEAETAAITAAIERGLSL